MEDNSYIKKNYDLAFKYFKDAADQGNAMGQAGLGQLYMNGYGVMKVTVVAGYSDSNVPTSILKLRQFIHEGNEE